MSTSTRLCLDASVVIRIVQNPDGISPGNLSTDLRFAALFAPALLRYELTNAFHRMAAHGELSINAAISLLETAISLPIQLIGDDRQHSLALEMANRFNLSAAYDAHYLAVSELNNLEFWTADRRLFNAVSGELPWVNLAV